MSLNPNLKECRIDKAQEALVDFVLEVKNAFEANGDDLNNIPIDTTVDWAKSVLQGTQDVKSPDEARQVLIDDLRHFLKDIRKAFTKHSDDLNDIDISATLTRADDLITRSGAFAEPEVPAPRRPSL